MNKEINIMDFKNIKVLITGGAGFIGSNLAIEFVKRGAIVSIFDNLDPHSGGNIFNLEQISDKVKIYFNDLLNFDSLVNAIINQDIIINCAASTSHPFSMKEPLIDLDVNSRGVLNLLEAIRRFNPKTKLIHIGTSTQLGHLIYKPGDEKHPEFPTDIYSANKSVSEKYVLIYSKAYRIDATVVRLSNTYGPRASIHSSDFTFNNFFIGLALQNKEITVYGDGKQLRNTIFIEDAANAILLIAQKKETNGETYFIVGDKHYSVAEIAETTIRIIGKGKVKHIAWPREREATEIGDAVLSNAKIKNIIKWAPIIDLEEGLYRTNQYFSTCFDKYLR